MKRMLWLVVLAVVLWSPFAMAANTVVIESKQVNPGDTGVFIGIQITNDVEIRNIVMPLEVRELDPGSYITALAPQRTPGGRLSSILTGINIINTYANPDGVKCKTIPGGYKTIGAPNYISPDGVLFSIGKLFASDPNLPVGSDPVTGSLRLKVSVNSVNGRFEVDTSCADPSNHITLVWADTVKNVLSSFTKGTIQIGTPNHPPVARDTAWATNRDVAKAVSYLPASDPDAGQVLTFFPTIFPLHGNIGVMNGLTGAFTYTPASHYCGPDSLQYMVCDNATSLLCASGWVRITVNCTNDAPVARDTSLITAMNTPDTLNKSLATDVDPEQTLTYAILSGPFHGATSSFNPANGKFIYTPTTGYSGPDSLKYTVCDNGVPVMCDTGTVRWTITSVNHKPTAVCIDRTVEVGANCQAAADINNGSSDPDGDPFTPVQVPAGPYPMGVTPVKLIVTDNKGLADTCQANVTVIDTVPPAITCPANFTARTAPGRCDTAIIFTLTRAANASDNCPIPLGVVYTSPGITITGNPPSGVFPKGVSTVTATATDINGLSNSCTFTVTVEDHEKPVVSCPGTINQSNDPGQCTAVVSYSPSASDNCTPAPIWTVNPPSGSTFPVGTTPVKVVATDASGNKDSCTFNVIVHDTTKPVIACPQDFQVPTDPGQCSAIVSFSPSPPTDNCAGPVNVVAVPPSGSAFPKGQTTVNVTATDAAGNQTTCSFKVTVTDNEKPVVTCPPTVNVTIPHGQTTGIASFNPTATDNCPGVVKVVTPPSGSSFPLGITTVWCVATDAAGNKDSCSFSVHVVVGNSPPVLDPIGPKTVNEGSNLTFPVVAHDLDGDAGITLSMISNPSGSTFTDHGSGSGTFDWTPSCTQGGSIYHVKFIASDGIAADTQEVAITVVDIPEILVAAPNSITINYQTGAPVPSPIPVSLTDPGCSGQFAWHAVSSDAWFTSDADTGTTPSNVHVLVNPAGLSVGDHQATVTFGARAAGKTDFVASNIVTVHLHVGPAPHDSVWVTTGSGKLGDTVALDVNFCNNHEATGISVGLQYTSYNMHVVGGNFIGSRVASLGTKSITVSAIDRTICIAAIPMPADPRIAEGCGKLATLLFVYDSAGSCPFPESTVVNEFTVPPGCSTMLTDTIPASVIPAFVPGYVSLICPPHICGEVKNVAGGPLQDATVQLWSTYPTGSVLATAITGPDGKFCFENLTGAGPFDLRIFRQDYCTKIMTGVGPTGTSLLEIVLDQLPVVKTTPHVAWYWSENATLSGVPLMPGDVITAVDPNGIVCGKTVVGIAGRYNIYVMGDDLTTPGVDEGASDGDLITLYLNCTCPLLIPTPWHQSVGTRFDANFDCSSKTVDVAVCDPWTLFSFNVTPPNPAPANVLASIVDEYQIVFTSTCAYGPLSWDENRPFNDLNSMDPFHGYWMKSSAANIGPIAIAGVPVPVTTPIDLCEGWNLISYLPDVPDTFTHALNGINGQYLDVFGYECANGYRSWDANRPAFLNDLNCMKPLHGYWVKTTTGTTLNYPVGGYTCSEGGPSLNKPVNLLTRVTPTPWVMDFWSVANTSTSGLRAGDDLTVRTSAGVICGECLVGADGAFLVHVYGDDPTTAGRIEGAAKGEALQFEVNGQPATVTTGSAVWTERESVRLTVVSGRVSPVPSDYALLQNYPNPFNPSTVIKFRLPVAADAKLTIYNVLGQTVRVLFNGSLSAGEYSYEWNGQNENGQTAQSGIYFYRLETPSWTDVKKMTFLK